LHTDEQHAFDASLKIGDCSFREIPVTIETNSLIESHKSRAFDHSGIRADKNLVFPLDRFRELQSAGAIGELNRRHLSFMGSIVGPRLLIDETAPQAAELLRVDAVDVAFLTPA
jgi:D-proline reductase (dithiol) PrdB